MKISKLFHWLYALLMLLPFAFFVPSVLYYAFNDNSTMQTVEVPKTETIAVDFNQLCDVSSDTYTIEGYRTDSIWTSPLVHFYTFNGFNEKVNHVFVGRLDTNVVGISLNSGNNGQPITGRFDLTNGYLADGGLLVYLARSNTSISYIGDVVLEYQLFDLTQMFGQGNEPTLEKFNQLFPLSYYPYTESELMQITYDTGETMELVENTDIINYAWESIWNLPLFSWSKVSFVAIPFTYITGLFGLAASNSINYVITYFASISIIWLVFDVIMYVPLLVHRWLDKGIVE